MPGEAVNLAVRALEAEPALRQRFGTPIVLTDDYLLMSRASQRLVNLLATNKIAVAGNEDDILPLSSLPLRHWLCGIRKDLLAAAARDT